MIRSVELLQSRGPLPNAEGVFPFFNLSFCVYPLRKEGMM